MPTDVLHSFCNRSNGKMLICRTCKLLDYGKLANTNSSINVYICLIYVCTTNNKNTYIRKKLTQMHLHKHLRNVDVVRAQVQRTARYCVMLVFESSAM